MSADTAGAPPLRRSFLRHGLEKPGVGFALVVVVGAGFFVVGGESNSDASQSITGRSAW